MAGQVDIRRPAARYGQTIDRQGQPAGQGDRFQRLAASGVPDPPAHDQRCALDRGGGRYFARVDHRRDRNAFRRKVACRLPAAVVVGENRQMLARRDRIAVGVAAHGARQHDARPVVVGKSDRAFGRARAEDRAFGIDAPVHQPNLINNYEQVLSVIGMDNYCIVDARSKSRFDGTIEEPRPGLRSGHIPTSKNLPYAEVLHGNKFKSKTELAELFKSLKIENKNLVFSCGSGITACILYMANELAGFENEKSVYDGSWTEWGSLSQLPIETTQ